MITTENIENSIDKVFEIEINLSDNSILRYIPIDLLKRIIPLISSFSEKDFIINTDNQRLVIFKSRSLSPIPVLEEIRKIADYLAQFKLPDIIKQIEYLERKQC